MRLIDVDDLGVGRCSKDVLPAISTDHEGGAQYSLNFWPDDFCSYGEPKEGNHADDHD